MSRVLIIGCGGVASVAIQKCCQVSEVFTDICIASRTKSKCDDLADKLRGKTATNITTAKVDADNVDELVELINTKLNGTPEYKRGVYIDGYMYMFGVNDFKVEKVFDFREIEAILKEAEEVYIRILPIHMNSGVTFEFDRE